MLGGNRRWIEGAIIGGIIDGEDGAVDGAIIGGSIGAIDGAIREQERERWHYRDRYVPHRQHQPRKQTGTGRLVLDIQLALRQLGYNPGPADGVAGQATARAVAAYKRDYGLPQDNIINSALLDHMRRQGG